MLNGRIGIYWSALIVFAVCFLNGKPAFAGSHWSYCRQTVNAGNSVKTYYSAVFFYDFGGDAGVDPKVARDVRVAFRQVVDKLSGVVTYGDPFCFIPLATQEATQQQTERKVEIDKQNILYSPAVDTGWHP